MAFKWISLILFTYLTTSYGLFKGVCEEVANVNKCLELPEKCTDNCEASVIYEQDKVDKTLITFKIKTLSTRFTATAISPDGKMENSYGVSCVEKDGVKLHRIWLIGSSAEPNKVQAIPVGEQANKLVNEKYESKNGIVECSFGLKFPIIHNSHTLDPTTNPIKILIATGELPEAGSDLPVRWHDHKKPSVAVVTWEEPTAPTPASAKAPSGRPYEPYMQQNLTFILFVLVLFAININIYL